jgi:hypothetical protein
VTIKSTAHPRNIDIRILFFKPNGRVASGTLVIGHLNPGLTFNILFEVVEFFEQTWHVCGSHDVFLYHCVFVYL